jgi:hypothetical protein
VAGETNARSRAGTSVIAARPDPRDDPFDAAVNLITPISRMRAAFRHASHKLALGSDASLELARRVGLPSTKPLEHLFRRLSHLHYARWSVCRRLSHLPRAKQPRETGPFTLQLFTSYFDHGWRPYLGSFIESTQDGLGLLWGDAPTWRSPSHGHRRFENFVVDQQVPNLHVFSAYPQWSCNNVRALLRYHQDRLSEDAVRVALAQIFGPRPTDDELEQAFTRRVQHVLGRVPAADPAMADTPAGKEPVPEPHRRPTHGATFLIPMTNDSAEAMVEKTLLDHATLLHERSPFATVEGTHFARVAVIDSKKYVEHRPGMAPFASSYLLLSAEIGADTGWWLKRIASEAPIAAVLERTYLRQPANPAAVAKHLRAHCEIKPSLEHINYPHTSVVDIYEASRTRGSP